MTSTVQKIGINIGGSSTNEVRFSTLRDTFFQTDPDVPFSGSSMVRASELLRTTNLPSDFGAQTNPTVPDAVENSNIVTTNSNWRVQHFNQSVKWYNVIQTDTDLNYNITSQSWNSNLIKNIVKRMKINGTLGSNSTSTSSTFSGSAYNLRVEVYGNIYGYGGRGGGTDPSFPISGENGGDALNVTSSTGRIVVDVKGTGTIRGGGGGGEKGKTGDNGANGTCYEYYYINQCSVEAPHCAGGWNQIESSWGCCRWDRGCAEARWKRTCQRSYSVNGGVGGAGGNGGRGRGYNYQSGSLDGVGGVSGTSGNGCGSTDGLPGETGGSGGDWGRDGGETTNTGTKGLAGKAVSGSNYDIIGSTSNIL